MILLFSPILAAQELPYAEVEQIQVLRGAPPGAQAMISRDGGEVWEALSEGDALLVGDEIKTLSARVRVRLVEIDHWFVLSADSQMVMEEWGATQLFGQILYRYQDQLFSTAEEGFTTQATQIKAFVDGTRYLVEVEGEDGTVHVQGVRHTVSVYYNPSLTPTPGPPSAAEGDHLVATLGPGDTLTWRPGEEPRLTERHMGFGLALPPRRSLGLWIGAGYGYQEAVGAGSARLNAALFGRQRLIGPASLTAELGLSNTPSTSQFPTSFGLEFQLSRLVLGGQGGLLLGWKEDCAAEDPRDVITLVVKGSGALHAGYRLPLGRHFEAEVRLSAGWATGPYANGALGASVRF